MTNDELDRLQALADEATAGPWSCAVKDSNCVVLQPGSKFAFPGRVCLVDYAGNGSRADASFIAASRDAMPALIAEVRRLREALASIESLWTLPVSARDAIDYAVDVAQMALGESNDD